MANSRISPYRVQGEDTEGEQSQEASHMGDGWLSEMRLLPGCGGAAEDPGVWPVWGHEGP